MKRKEDTKLCSIYYINCVVCEDEQSDRKTVFSVVESSNDHQGGTRQKLDFVVQYRILLKMLDMIIIPHTKTQTKT